MKVLLQRVKQASVKIGTEIKSKIGRGYLLMVGIAKGDLEEKADSLAKKIVSLRLFENKDNKFDKELKDVDGEILVISQFTLFADYSKGKRPFFGEAEEPKRAKKMYEYFIKKLQEVYDKDKVKEGVFGAKMEVEIMNDGPVTIMLGDD